MGEQKQKDDDAAIRVDLRVSEIVSPDVFNEMQLTKPRTRRYRVLQLASLGLLFEKALMNGGVSIDVGAAAFSVSRKKPTAKHETKEHHPTLQHSVAPVTQGGSAEVGEGTVLEVPEGFGDALNELK
jgi:hypothetical protein